MRRLNPFRVDLLIGGALLVELELELALLVPGGAHRWLAALLLAAVAAGVAVRRREPLAGVALALGALLGLQLLGKPYTDHLPLAPLSAFLVTFSLGARADGRRLAAGIVLALALAIGVTIADPTTTASSYVFSTVIVVLGPVTLGRVLRDRHLLNRALRERTAALQRERADAAERVVSDERARIAGELHDVVAHALSAMTVQAAGARRLVLSDADRARDAFAAVEATGRDALDELRRLLGVLRREDEELALAPQPSLRHAAALVRRTALPVQLVIDGEARELPAGVDLTAYRVLQEALDAAARGSAACAEVRVRYAPDAVELEVLDDGGARELIGVGERVALHGGRLSSRRRGGGHAVRARLPLPGGAV